MERTEEQEQCIGEERGEEEVVDEGMREKEKMEGGKEKNEWSERVTEKGRECSSFRAFLRAVISCSKSFVEQCIMCSCEWVSKSLRAPTLFWGNM